jgi:hypothetical protein
VLRSKYKELRSRYKKLIYGYKKFRSRYRKFRSECRELRFVYKKFDLSVGNWIVVQTFLIEDYLSKLSVNRT